MINNFWKKIKKPFFCLAPMADVTDPAFRYMLAKYGKNVENKNQVVFWTEFVSADGLCHKEGRKKLLGILKFSKIEKPIVAQIFGAKPENIKKACQLISKLGFDGIDINMGCPDKSVIKQGAGSALIKTPKLARDIIQAAISGANGLPISVKTRLGFNTMEYQTWLPELLKENISALTVHFRTKKEMSKVKAHYELAQEVVKIVRAVNKDVKLIANGDILSTEEGIEKMVEYGFDGVMIGRGVFGNPEFFAGNNILSLEKKLKYLLEHTKLFEKLLRTKKADSRSFDVMKKHFKAYVNGFDGAKELRVKLMTTENSKQVAEIIKNL
jgi:nifR3 family TIM-barrel protein